jgi:glucokinase
LAEQVNSDIGGTQIRVAVYPANGELSPIAQKRIPTTGIETTPLERLAGLINELWPPETEVLAIGVGAPGFIDSAKGIVYEAPNIPGWVDLHLKSFLQARFNVPIFVGNDANLAAMGEWRYGAGVGHHDLLFLTISTGIGGGVILNDQLLLGSRGLAVEAGHVTVLPDGPLCGCGQRGHLEAISSGTAIARYVADQLAAGSQSTLLSGPHPNAREISLAAEHGDPLARAALNRAGTYLGYALADFLHLFNPSIVIFGGGVSRSGSLLLDPVRAAFPQRLMSPEYARNLVITTAALGDDAGLVGALTLAQTGLFAR